MIRSLQSLVVALVILAGGACGDSRMEQGVFDIAVVPNLDLNLEADLLAHVETVQLIVDGTDYDDDEQQHEGDLQIWDYDDDGENELIYVEELTADQLPTFRLSRGGLPAAVSIWVEGFDAQGKMTAVSPVAAIEFEPGEQQERPLSLALLEPYLPLRAWPAFSSGMDCIPDVIIVGFSVALHHPSLEGQVRFNGETLGLDVLWTTAGPPNPTLQIAAPIVPGANTLEIGQGIRDEQGRSLKSAFEGHMTVSERAVPCGSTNPWSCWETPDDTGRCLPGFECYQQVCVPISCDYLSCPPASACDPATVACEVDCRLYGHQNPCPGDRPVCDPETGLCGP